jgi:opacity protein-like surface antigen
MVRVTYSLLAGAAALISTAANAADLPVAMPMVQKAPIVEEIGSGWYLRGDVGFTQQNIGSLVQRNDFAPGVLNLNPVGMGFDAAPLVGAGIGFQWNNWLRFDATGEWRGSANFHGVDNVFVNGGVGADVYSARKSEALFLANAYVDLGTWWCVTPFIGAGIGMARIDIASFVDHGVFNFVDGNGNTIGQSSSVAFSDENAQWNVAWALHAGVSYHVTPNMSVEVAYRYVNLGSAMTGPTHLFDGTPTRPGDSAFHFNNLTSQDLKVGVRWMFDQPVMAAPLMRRG